MKKIMFGIAWCVNIAAVSMFHSACASTPAALFQGYDSIVGDTRFTAVSGTHADSGASSIVEYHMYTDADSLRRNLGISQSASASFGPFGGGDEKASFYDSLQTTKYSVSIVIHATHILSTETATNATFESGITPDSFLNFKPHIQQLKSFFSSYGDSYVSAITRGGEYIAVYTFHTETSNEQKQLAASISGHATFGVITGSADIQAMLNSAAQSVHSDVTFLQKIFGINNPTYPTPDKAIDFALSFPSKQLDGPTVLSYETSGYEHVPHAGDLSEIVANRKYFVGDIGTPGVSGKLSQLQQLQTQIHRILGTYQFYGAPSDSKLSTADAQVGADINALNSQIRQFESSPTDSFNSPKLPSLDLGSPGLSFKTTDGQACGGPGGAPFEDVPVDTAIYRRTRLAAVQVNAGNWIDHVALTYETDGVAGAPQVHGGNTGSTLNPLRILPGQFLSRVDLHCVPSGQEAFVKQINFVIGADGRSTGGGGLAEIHGSPMTWTPPPGSVILGFKGRSGVYLDQLQPVFITFGPATWQ
ncbi:jacalin-like lectin [Paraburkholderia sp. JPY419]|uniref:jacalin-like lectin n=1 Tax=Paraburkholderia sp. JPY419 TaxID=667660 RepID=UPI003D1D07B9